MKISEEAVDAALDVLFDHGHNGIECRPQPGLDSTVRAALEAAAPHLVPTRDQIAIALHDVECPDRRCEASMMGHWYEEADAVLALLSGSGVKS